MGENNSINFLVVEKKYLFRVLLLSDAVLQEKETFIQSSCSTMACTGSVQSLGAGIKGGDLAPNCLSDTGEDSNRKERLFSRHTP